MDQVGPRSTQDAVVFEKQIMDAMHQAGIQHPDIPVHVAKRPRGRFEQVAIVASNAIHSAMSEQSKMPNS